MKKMENDTDEESCNQSEKLYKPLLVCFKKIITKEIHSRNFHLLHLLDKCAMASRPIDLRKFGSIIGPDANQVTAAPMHVALNIQHVVELSLYVSLVACIFSPIFGLSRCLLRLYRYMVPSVDIKAQDYLLGLIALLCMASHPILSGSLYATVGVSFMVTIFSMILYRQYVLNSTVQLPLTMIVIISLLYPMHGYTAKVCEGIENPPFKINLIILFFSLIICGHARRPHLLYWCFLLAGHLFLTLLTMITHKGLGLGTYSETCQERTYFDMVHILRTLVLSLQYILEWRSSSAKQVAPNIHIINVIQVCGLSLEETETKRLKERISNSSAMTKTDLEDWGRSAATILQKKNLHFTWADQSSSVFLTVSLISICFLLPMFLLPLQNFAGTLEVGALYVVLVSIVASILAFRGRFGTVKRFLSRNAVELFCSVFLAVTCSSIKEKEQNDGEELFKNALAFVWLLQAMFFAITNLDISFSRTDFRLFSALPAVVTAIDTMNWCQDGRIPCALAVWSFKVMLILKILDAKCLNEISKAHWIIVGFSELSNFLFVIVFATNHVVRVVQLVAVVMWILAVSSRT